MKKKHSTYRFDGLQKRPFEASNVGKTSEPSKVRTITSPRRTNNTKASVEIYLRRPLTQPSSQTAVRTLKSTVTSADADKLTTHSGAEQNRRHGTAPHRQRAQSTVMHAMQSDSHTGRTVKRLLAEVHASHQIEQLRVIRQTSALAGRWC